MPSSSSIDVEKYPTTPIQLYSEKIKYIANNEISILKKKQNKISPSPAEKSKTQYSIQGRIKLNQTDFHCKVNM
jgi:phosphatidate phosphatase PAH1